MTWTNAVAAVAIFVLAAYLWRHADDQATDEAKLSGAGPRITRFRVLNLKGGALFLAIVAAALLAAGMR